MERARFRYNVSISLAGVLAFIGAIPIATVGFGHEGTPAYAYVLLLILLIPIAVAVWGWRAGTDADASGLRVRALFGSRQIPWNDVALLAPQGRRVYAQLSDGRAVRLAAVSRADLPRLIGASGQQLAGRSEAAAADQAADEVPANEAQPAPAAVEADARPAMHGDDQ